MNHDVYVIEADSRAFGVRAFTMPDDFDAHQLADSRDVAEYKKTYREVRDYLIDQGFRLFSADYGSGIITLIWMKDTVNEKGMMR